jgi:hypothetical protein
MGRITIFLDSGKCRWIEKVYVIIHLEDIYHISHAIKKPIINHSSYRVCFCQLLDTLTSFFGLNQGKVFPDEIFPLLIHLGSQLQRIK